MADITFRNKSTYEIKSLCDFSEIIDGGTEWDDTPDIHNILSLVYGVFVDLSSCNDGKMSMFSNEKKEHMSALCDMMAKMISNG